MCDGVKDEMHTAVMQAAPSSLASCVSTHLPALLRKSSSLKGEISGCPLFLLLHDNLCRISAGSWCRGLCLDLTAHLMAGGGLCLDLIPTSWQ